MQPRGAKPAVALTGDDKFEKLDLDGNGKFDHLRARIGVTTPGGRCTWWAATDWMKQLEGAVNFRPGTSELEFLMPVWRYNPHPPRPGEDVLRVGVVCNGDTSYQAGVVPAKVPALDWAEFDVAKKGLVLEELRQEADGSYVLGYFALPGVTVRQSIDGLPSGAGAEGLFPEIQAERYSQYKLKFHFPFNAKPGVYHLKLKIEQNGQTVEKEFSYNHGRTRVWGAP